ncbi:hypothetical protein [Streptomyces botrytidirepellens]|uniref:hypothetical protein n=1 Tax=Streptomyces botrytidirepellens TaxID=2486417 RepID=UPI0011CE1895|nr:hypothetical protein [Streptomyces botrytidirepellens]
MPGARVRRVKAAGRSLTVVLVDEAQNGAVMTVRHRDAAVVAALGADIEAIMDDAGPAEHPRPVSREVVPVWPVRVLTGLRDRVLHGSPWWRRALWYVVLGLPPAVWLPVEPRGLGLLAWLSLPLSIGMLRIWVGMAELDTRWVIWRRGVTVRARFETDLLSESPNSYRVHFRTLDGHEVTANAHLRGRGDEIRYDPQDPTRVLVPTRVAWLGIALAAFMVSGIWGVACGVPTILWLNRLSALPF